AVLGGGGRRRRLAGRVDVEDLHDGVEVDRDGVGDGGAALRGRDGIDEGGIGAPAVLLACLHRAVEPDRVGLAAIGGRGLSGRVVVLVCADRRGGRRRRRAGPQAQQDER